MRHLYDCECAREQRKPGGREHEETCILCTCEEVRKAAQKKLETLWCEPPLELMKAPQNPKAIRAQKDGKVPLEYLVYEVLADDARVQKHGADRYGIRNWRKDKILASTYEGAMLRHFTAWATGEDVDPDSGLPHLSHLRACCAVVLDAQRCDTLIDDRDRVQSISEGDVQ